MFKIFKHSHFYEDPFGHGGNKRTAQINGILNDAGISYQEVKLNTTGNPSSKLNLYLKGLQQGKVSLSDLKKTYAVGRYTALFKNFIQQEQPDLFIWESTVEYYLLWAELLRAANIPVIGMPHNLESLVPGSVSLFSGKPSPEWLQEEVEYLSACQKVYTISNEESWLLSTMRINAAWLPYHPPKATNDFLLNIRSQKPAAELNKRPVKSILTLGTYHNQPTAKGITTLLKHFANQLDVIIHVAGFGTEQLQAKYTAPNIFIHGGVTSEQLAELIARANCAVIYQQASGGALTRITELLTAGLPVYINTAGANSCTHLEGVTLYNSFEDLNWMLNNTMVTNPPIPTPPLQVDEFVNSIKKFINS